MDKYDYAKSIYRSAKATVAIGLPRSRCDFQQSAYAHARLGSGCPRCSGKGQDTADFIDRARVAHGKLYDYSKTRYVRNKDKVVITCAKHGDFEQLPYGHLSGKGCRKCAYENNAILQPISSAEFVRRACIIHDSKYVYSNVEYVNGRTKVKIVCPDHGE